MDYKRIVKSRKNRCLILRILSFVPDKMMISLQYKIKFGRKINWKEPKRFTEKLQCYKLYYRNPLMKKCVNKYSVRDYVSKCGLDEILVPILGIYDNPCDVDFGILPKQFVIKDTLGGGGNSVIICREKNQLDVSGIMNKLKTWVKSSTSYKVGGREWPYGGQKHQIIIEEMLPSNQDVGGLIDYKFFCFYGKPEYLYVVADRKVGDKAGFGIFTADFRRLNVQRTDEKPLERDVKKPDNFEEMLNVASVLSKPFPEVRVDLYSVEGKIYFGELTFFDGSGYMSFEPDEFDYIMGKKFILPTMDKV